MPKPLTFGEKLSIIRRNNYNNIMDFLWAAICCGFYFLSLKG